MHFSGTRFVRLLFFYVFGIKLFNLADMQNETPESFEHTSKPSEVDTPLVLSVHTLPSMSQDALSHRETLAANPKRSNWVLWLMFVLCASPVIASYVTYYFIRPQSLNVNGELINPSVSIPHVQVQDEFAKSFDLDALKGQWLLLSVAPISCESECQQHLYLQRQLIASLGAESDRVDWIWLAHGAGDIPIEVRPGVQQARVVRMDASAIQAWLSPGAGHALEDYFYLVDPQGQWMERFLIGKEVTQLASIKKDLVRLLRASASWDRAGR
jgi:hypothetical protein